MTAKGSRKTENRGRRPEDTGQRAEICPPASGLCPLSLTWHGCYETGWKGLIVPEAFAHPAKFSRALIERIYDHMLAQGYISKGDTVGDPFGGIGTGGIIAAYRGLRWVGVELEPKFVGLAQKNFALHLGKWRTLRLPVPIILKGDSRAFDQHVAAIVSSPPFTQGYSSSGGINKRGYEGKHRADENIGKRTYQSTGGDREPENIERCEAGDLDAVISSPPYVSGGHHTDVLQGGNKNGRGQGEMEGYGASVGQIASCPAGELEAVISSPPYADSVNSAQSGIDWDKAERPERWSGSRTRPGCQAAGSHQMKYGSADDGQIGALKGGEVDAVVSSPPYGDGQVGTGKGDRKGWRGYTDTEGGKGAAARGHIEALPVKALDSSGETYWQAMKQVYAACFSSLKLGGYIAVVVKDYVKNKQRVPLCDDTLRLLVHLGFTPVERIRAMLVEETEHNDLLEGTVTRRKERKSFFRRLAEKKGSPRIDFEEVLICKRP